jgi:DNA polymerase-3 subunit alpha
MNETFTHLRVHSHYTLLGATATVEQLVARAAAEALPALALTDSGALYGAVAFNRACLAADILPILGMTLRVSLPEAVNLPGPRWGELVLLAKGPAGYRSLCGLSSLVQGGAQREQLLDRGLAWEALRPFTTHLIAIDSGQTGWLARLVAAGQPKLAARYASRLAGLFEEDGYLGVTIGQPADVALAQQTSGVAARFGLQTVALQPVFCLEPADAPRLRLLAAIDQNCHLSEVPAERLPGGGLSDGEQHWLPAAAVAERFARLPEALDGVGAIVAKCEPALPDGRPIWPKLELPEAQTAEQALGAAAKSGIAGKVRPIPPSQRLSPGWKRSWWRSTGYGFAPLFLLVADITRFARETAVPVNTRGSVANSLVAYCLGITQVDPIANELLFERFLNPARANLPDIDLDFCSRRRDEVLHYVRRKVRRGPRGAGGHHQHDAAKIGRARDGQGAWPGRAGDQGADGAAAARLAPGSAPPQRKKRWRICWPKSKMWPGTQILAEAFAIIGQPHHMSIHPGGIVISPGPMTDLVPVQLAPKGFLITQYDHRDVEKIGLPKIDLLGIRALTVLADTAEAIRATLDPTFDLRQIPADDEETAVHLQNGETIGVFQCESSGARRTLRQLKASTLRDLAVANAFFKPGPAMGGMAQAFVRRYRGEEKVHFLHPALAPILGSTQGVMLFQEQVLRVATEIAHLSWAEADHLRRGMSKFQADEMAAMQQRFVSGCQAKSGFTQEQATTLWEQVMPFAGYGFNQGHATAYADVSYRSAYLKAHYPAQFLCARLRDYGGFHHPAIYIAEAQRLGIAVRPPHVNFSGRKFTLTTDESSPVLWMGLGQVRDLRRSAVRAMVKERAVRPFTSLRDLLSRVELQKKEITHLIQCGALDGLGDSRAALLAEAADVARAGSAHQLGFDLGLKSAVQPESVVERLAWETAVLGWPVSVNPLAAVPEQVANNVLLRDLPRLRNHKATIAGARLPGWTGGRGFYFGDGDSFEIVQLEKTAAAKIKMKSWLPYRLIGFWREDAWGSGWFEVVDS